MNVTLHKRPTIRLTAALITAAIALAACGGAASTGSPPAGNSNQAAGGTSSGAAAPDRVLPVTANPIANTSTAKSLTIDSVLVENNVDATGKAVDDHLEVALSNTGATPLTGLEFFYTFTDPTAKLSESYYAKLPSNISIPAGGKQVVNFDNSGTPGSVPVNEFSLYATSKNALDVKVVASATGTAVTTATVKKDAGGAEAAD